MTKKNKNLLGILAILAVIGIFGFSQGWFSQLGLTATGSEVNLDSWGQNFPTTAEIVTPVYGILKCRAEGWSEPDPDLGVYTIEGGILGEYWTSGKLTKKCLVPEDSSCKIEGQIVADCSGGTSYTTIDIYIGGLKYDVPAVASYGQTYEIVAKCWKSLPIIGTFYVAPAKITVNFKNPNVPWIYKETEGYGIQGRVTGSKYCQITPYIQSKIETLRTQTAAAVQDAKSRLDDLQLYQGWLKVIPLGDDVPIIVGWKKDPAYGNVNPYGKYSGMNVVCSGNALYQATPIATVGGITTLFTQGQFITNTVGGSQVCCSNYDCLGGTCSAYECSGDKCAGKGECLYGNNPTPCGQSGGCVETSTMGGKFITYGCDGNGCCNKIEENRPCCQVQCDRMSTSTIKYVCDKTQGCVANPIQVDCGTNYCCNVPPLKTDSQNSVWETQYCTGTLTCCPMQGDERRGTCLPQCSAPKCNNNNKCEPELGETATNCKDCEVPSNDTCETKATIVLYDLPVLGKATILNPLTLFLCYLEDVTTYLIKIVKFILCIILGVLSFKIFEKEFIKKSKKKDKQIFLIVGALLGIAIAYGSWIFIPL